MECDAIVVINRRRMPCLVGTGPVRDLRTQREVHARQGFGAQGRPLAAPAKISTLSSWVNADSATD
jgi:hypothetical protein